MNRQTSILVTALMVITALSISVMIGSMKSQNKQAVQENISTRTEMREGFMKGCLLDSTYEGYCTCAWDYLQDNYTDKQILSMGVAASNGEDVPAYDYINQACEGEL